MNDKTNFLWQIFTAVNGWVAFADTKAMGLLAADGIIAGMIFVNIKDIESAIHHNTCLQITAGLAAFLLLLSIFFALRCVIPTLNFGQPNSALFFGHISQLSVVDYEQKLKDIMQDDDKVASQVIHQIWANSTVASKKYRFIAYSAWALVAGVILSLIPLASQLV